MLVILCMRYKKMCICEGLITSSRIGLLTDYKRNFQNMGPQWLTLVCVCALAASTTLSEAFPTQETLVVAKSETSVRKDYDFL